MCLCIYKWYAAHFQIYFKTMYDYDGWPCSNFQFSFVYRILSRHHDCFQNRSDLFNVSEFASQQICGFVLHDHALRAFERCKYSDNSIQGSERKITYEKTIYQFIIFTFSYNLCARWMFDFKTLIIIQFTVNEMKPNINYIFNSEQILTVNRWLE